MISTMVEYRKRRSKILEFLGGCCAECGSKSRLHIDHKDHTKKSFNISKNWARSWEMLLPELKKCQLLYSKHHERKTLDEGSLAKGWNKQKRAKHGTVWMYSKYGCRCEPCRAAKSNYGRSSSG